MESQTKVMENNISFKEYKDKVLAKAKELESNPNTTLAEFYTWIKDSEKRFINMFDAKQVRDIINICYAKMNDKYGRDTIYKLDKNPLWSKFLKKEITLEQCFEEWKRLSKESADYLHNDLLANGITRCDEHLLSLLAVAGYYSDILRANGYAEKCDKYNLELYPNMASFDTEGAF